MPDWVLFLAAGVEVLVVLSIVGYLCVQGTMRRNASRSQAAPQRGHCAGSRSVVHGPVMRRRAVQTGQCGPPPSSSARSSLSRRASVLVAVRGLLGRELH